MAADRIHRGALVAKRVDLGPDPPVAQEDLPSRDHLNAQCNSAPSGKELGADEDVRALDDVIDHAALNAQQAAGIASEISDNARYPVVQYGRWPG